MIQSLILESGCSTKLYIESKCDEILHNCFKNYTLKSLFDCNCIDSDILHSKIIELDDSKFEIFASIVKITWTSSNSCNILMKFASTTQKKTLMCPVCHADIK